MILPIKPESLMWLLPVVFMLHDFEEIIMMKPWLNCNWKKLERRFPARIVQEMAKQKTMSHSAFALAVAEEFLLLSAFTFIGAEFELYEFWAGLLLGFFIHLLVHIGQFIVLHEYVPVIITSIPGAVYSLVALHDLNLAQPLNWNLVVLWTMAFLVVIVVNMILTLKIARKFDDWLRRNYSVPECFKYPELSIMKQPLEGKL